MKKARKGYMNAVWLTCPQCQHNWHQEIIETKTVQTPCRCNIDMDMELIETSFGGGLWVNIFMSSTKELGSFTKDESKLSLIDYSIA